MSFDCFSRHFGFWVEVLIVLSDLLSILISQSCYLNRFIGFEAARLCIDDIEVLLEYQLFFFLLFLPNSLLHILMLPRQRDSG